MAWFTLRFYSNALRQETTVNVVMPDMIGEGDVVLPSKLPVVYLLHGYTNNQNRWLLDTNIHYLAKQYNLFVVMPYGGNSFYTDTVAGGDYETFLTTELPAQLRAWFGISEHNDNTHIAGNSMGAIGAVKYALTYPGRFQSVAAFSGPLDISFIQLSRQIDPETAEAVIHDFTDKAEWVEGGQNDPGVWIKTYKDHLKDKKTSEIKIAVYCGEDDAFLPLSQAFVERCRQEAVPVQFFTEPGEHNYAYWQKTLEHWLKARFDRTDEDA